MALVVQPGDRVIVALHEVDVPSETIEQMRERLSERHPGAEFTFITGASGLAVARPGEA